MAWSKFGKMSEYLQDEKFPLSLKKKIFTQCVIQTLLYAAETWATTKMLNNKIRSTQLSMERKMLGITWQDKVTNKKIREQTKLPDALQLLKSYKWKWAGHVARASENWANTVTCWTPADKRKKGRPKTRWVEDIKARDRNRITAAQDRTAWSSQREAFVQQWNSDGGG